MIQRCFNPKHVKHASYGGRGIKVCERWLSFENFYADMGDRPPAMSLERVDVNGDYEPGNCRWGTTRQQSRNKRSTVVTFDDVQEIVGRFEHGEKQAAIAKRFGISVGYIGKIIHGDVWREIDRPYLANLKKPVSPSSGGSLVDAAKEHELLVARSRVDSTYEHTARAQPDLTGQRFGLLVVLRRGPNSSRGARRWLVRCSCPRATEKLVFSSSLARGKVLSCGCLFTRLKHGQSSGKGRKGSGAFISWARMLQRCTDPKCPQYPNYGGRGIRVCERWMEFVNFYADMGDRPAGMSLEREDVNGNYEPGNCRWATPREQARNTRATVVTFDVVQEIIGRFEHGETKASIGRRLGVDPYYVGALINGKSWTEIDRPYLKKAEARA
jgi:transcriptional regulator with XRE-family HTH domain